MIANIRELRSSTKEILNAVDRGDTVIITSRGKPCAKIVPFTSNEKTVKNHPAFGMWKNNPKVKSVEGFVKKLRMGRYAR